MHNKHNILPYITAIITSIIFGLSFLFSKRALSVASPLMLLSFRFLAAFTVMSILIALKVIKVNYKNKPLRWLLLLAVIEPVVYFIFETYGLQRTASSVGGLMIALIPIAVTVMAVYFLDEKPSAIETAFIITSVAGVALIVVMGSSGGEGSSVIGVLLLMGAVLSAAFFNIISRKISKDFSPMEITYFMMALGAVSFNVMAVIDSAARGELHNYFMPLKSTTFVTSVVYLGILSSIIAYFLINYTLSKIEASKSSVFSNISTIVSIVAGVIFLKESFQVYHIVGAVMILGGVWGANYFK
ncbi:MAG: DMT family transporter [Bacillota bacterium]|nr:DMT family transporter [Bacillota bacterium]